ncbi:acetyltransferase [Campylobacter corcagiensis]|nr:acetyltransferase [Campylobacter corcagiensis]
MEFKKAKLKDISLMQEMIKPEIESGVILPRSNDEIATSIRSYILAYEKDELIGYGALKIYSQKLAEIRSLVIKREFRAKGVGSALVKELLKEAKEYEIEAVFALTYRDKFFINLGFEVVDKDELPSQKIWADCIKCKNFPVCNEIAVIYKF